ncbi:hypothetical protein TCAL_03471 [Tigriopus californicus]|uniref:PDZ domain-containing protein n=1 Tax=Tigriopus californicus TaxID=6832 RepID=A0A553NNN8_TIGCA|nr:PDZ and LIM domain protein 1-like [Tigriopus californicus]TRY67035.1 hypothetical protein TCAL_03471 [Tigriopus californicus]|eukprot:TCALIF_03471-PA protein Name:"Similar to PDLIM1 PDZ and LIM domain protein 1 (Bos taurus)" AED:0.03 eAED:0.03 QI:373/1/1/1/0.66/0.75/4/298/192
MKEIHQFVLTKQSNEPFGFRLIGGKDEGLSLKIEKIVVGSAATDAGLKVRDFLVSVQGQKVLEMTHHQVVQLIRNAGNSLNLDIERGDHIVPNFEEIWPSGKLAKQNQECDPDTGINYVLSAMQEGVPGSRDEMFTTVGKPKIECHQYDNPINCYSEQVIKEMGDKGNWQMAADQEILHENKAHGKLILGAH